MESYKSVKNLNWTDQCPYRGAVGYKRAAICNAGPSKSELPEGNESYVWCRKHYRDCGRFGGSNVESKFIQGKRAERAAVKKPRECGCGCEGMTKGGEFLPGHDARHKGNLKRAIKALEEKTKRTKAENSSLSELSAEIERRRW